MLFCIVLLRAQGTYWLGRGVRAGVLHTRLAAKVTGPRTTQATVALQRWGPPLVTLSFLTVGVQTVVNAGAELIRMPFLRYSIAMVIGCLAWALIFATVGIAAVEASIALAARSPWASAAVVVLLLGAVALWVVLPRRRSTGDAAVAVGDLSP